MGAGFATGFETGFGTGLRAGLVTGLVTRLGAGLGAGFAGLAIPGLLALVGWLVRVAGAVDRRVSTTTTPVSIYKLPN